MTVTKPYVAAVGTSAFGRTDLTGRDLFSAAVAEAFEDGPDPADVVDALYVGNQSESYEHQIMHGTLLAEWCGLRHVPAERVEGCAAAGALALRHAVEDVRSGRRDAVLACGVEKMTAGGTAGATNALSAAFDRALEQRSGVTAPSQYALLAQRYLHDTDATEQDLARIAVKNHANGAANPRAQFRRETDVETVLDSDYVAPPLKLFDCAPVTDGAAVVLVASEAVARRFGTGDPTVRVGGVGAGANNIGVADRDLTFVEGAGFAPRGRGYESALPPAERSDGWTDTHLSTSGGLKARGHPIGATGIAQAVEVYEQLTGTATPDRQVDGATTGLLINEGGVADAVTVAHVLTT